MSLEALCEQAGTADYILFGEAHTNRCDHQVQADILQVLTGQGLRPVLGLEMVPVSKQPVLDEFNQGRLQVGQLDKALNWQKHWGHPFALYKPVFQVAAKAGVPLYALNIERSTLDLVREQGLEGLGPERRQDLPPKIISPPEAQIQVLKAEYSGHQEMFAEMGNATSISLERFFLAQSIWDSQMAYRAWRVHVSSQRPVIILAGSGHVEHGWGIPSRLRRLDPEARVLTLLGWRGQDRPVPEAATVFFYCPLRHTSRLGFEMEMLGQGARVVDVDPEDRAARSGLQKGDLILSVGGQPLTGLWDLHQAAVESMHKGQGLELVVRRKDKTRTLEIELPSRPDG
jgi:uncharacterized iron-regulated protein